MKLKFPNVLTVLFIITILVAMLTWIVPTGRYAIQTENVINGKITATTINPENITADIFGHTIAGTYKALPGNKQGLFDILMASIKGFYQAKETIIFVLILGGFINIAMSTHAINNGIISLMKRLKGNGIIAIPILMTLFAMGGTSYGMGEEAIVLYPILIPVMLAVGYDTLTAAAMIILGCGIGTLGSTVNPFATSIASDAANISISSGMWIRMCMLITGLIICIIYVMWYANKVKNNPKLSLVYDTAEADKKYFLKENNQDHNIQITNNQKIILWLFILSFVFMIYSLIPWSEIGINAIPMLGWGFTEISAFFLGMSILMGIVSGLSEEEFIDAFMAGVKDIVSVALVIGMARGIKIVMTDGMIADTMLFWAEQGLRGLSSHIFVIVNYIMHMLLSIFIPSSSGLAAFSVPIIAPMSDLVNVGRDTIVTGYQSANGLINLFSPTSFILMSALSVSRISLNKWLKFVMPLIAILFVHNVLFLLISI